MSSDVISFWRIWCHLSFSFPPLFLPTQSLWDTDAWQSHRNIKVVSRIKHNNCSASASTFLIVCVCVCVYLFYVSLSYCHFTLCNRAVWPWGGKLSFPAKKAKKHFFLIFKKGKKRKEKRSVGEGKTTRENAVPKLLP